MSAATRRLTRRLPGLVALVLLWLCLWGSVAPLTVVTGLVTAVAVTRIVELPPLPVVHRLRPVAAAALVGVVLGQVVLASVQVAGQAVRAVATRRAPTAALVRVPLAVQDDLLMTLTALAVSLVPGSVVVEADRAGAVLHLHVLGARSAADADRARAAVRATERRVVRALGSAAQREAVR